MHITRTSLSLLLAGTLTLVTAAARAELEVGPLLGAHFFSADNQLGRYLNGAPDLAPEHMAMVGLRLAWQPWDHVAAEGELALIPTYTRGASQPFTPILTYRGDLRIDVFTGRIRPFLLVGGGAYTLFSGDTALIRNSTQEYLEVGTGALLDVGRNWGLRADARMMFVPAVRWLTFTQDWELIAGFYYRFGLGRVQRHSIP